MEIQILTIMWEFIAFALNKGTYPFPLFIDVAEPKIVHFQNVELFADIFEDVSSLVLWLQQKKELWMIKCDQDIRFNLLVIKKRS